MSDLKIYRLRKDEIQRLNTCLETDNPKKYPIGNSLYELKPIIYFVVALFGLSQSHEGHSFMRFFSICILGFSFYISYCRMIYRGFID